MARMTLASIRAELDTLARHYGCTITIERTDKDGNADAAGRYVNVIVPSGVTSTGIICNNLTDAYNTIRQYLAQAGIVPSTDTFPANNLTAAVAAHHRRFVASLNDPQPEPPATTIDIASKYGTFTYQMVAWRCADKGNGGIASYPTWHETLDAHEWIGYRPLTTDRIRRIVTTWPAQNIATVELDNGYWYQVRYETMPAPAPEPYEPGVFGGAHPGDDEETIEVPYCRGCYAPHVDYGFCPSCTARNDALTAELNAAIPAIGGGSHAADTEVADAAARNRQREASNAQKMTLEAAQDAALEVGAMFGKSVHIYRTLKDGTPKSDGGWYRFEIDNTQRSAGYRNLANLLDGLRDMVKTWQETQPTPAQPKKQRTATTSQKRDNQRAERAALNEAYHANAETHAPDIAAILTDLGFTVTEQRESGGTPVTIWQSEHATIKQTPYTIRVYNGQPKRLPRHGDAELINSVEAGWIMRTQPTGYAAGVVAAILPLIETPDPYMQALDAMEAREAEQSAPLPELVLHGGQPSMSGPWELPAISGGSQDAETLSCADCGITSDDTDINPATFGDRAPRCWECMVAYIAYTDRLTCHHDADEPPARFCSQCGHDRTPNAPQPTDTGTSHDVTMPSDPDTGDRVTIEHTPEGGTIATGDTRPQSATLKMCGFKWSRQLGAWYVPNSRDRRPDMSKINKTAQALRANHATVTLDIDNSAVDPATAEANRAERLADRHAALHRKAEKLDAEASARFGAADTLADMIPFGQPILVGHHSEKRHRAHVAKIERNMDKGVEAFRASEDAEHRATAGERQQAHRLTAPATMRRIEKLETERRDLERRAARGQVGTIGGPTIAERLSDNAEHLAYWRAHLATLEAQGVKVWRPEDFTKGDLVLDQFGLVTVNRINKKSLSVTTHYAFDHGREWSKTITFDDIKGKATPEQAERFRTA